MSKLQRCQARCFPLLPLLMLSQTYHVLTTALYLQEHQLVSCLSLWEINLLILLPRFIDKMYSWSDQLISLAQNKLWKQLETASLALSKVAKNCTPARLWVSCKHVVFSLLVQATYLANRHMLMLLLLLCSAGLHTPAQM